MPVIYIYFSFLIFNNATKLSYLCLFFFPFLPPPVCICIMVGSTTICDWMECIKEQKIEKLNVVLSSFILDMH